MIIAGLQISQLLVNLCTQCLDERRIPEVTIALA